MSKGHEVRHLLVIDDIHDIAPAIMGTSINTNILIDDCIATAANIVKKIETDVINSDLKPSATYLDNVNSMGVSAGSLILHTLPDMIERTMGSEFKGSVSYFESGVEVDTCALVTEVTVTTDKVYSDEVIINIKGLVNVIVEDYVTGRLGESSEFSEGCGQEMV